MKFSRWSVAAYLFVIGTLALSACSGNGSATQSPRPVQTTVECGGKQRLSAGGPVTQEGAIEQFGYAYSRACPGRRLAYDANVSDVAVRAFVNNETDFSGSDIPLEQSSDQAAARCGSPAWNLPLVFSPIAITYNVSGVRTLNLDGPTAAKIFNGAIARWNDPAIQALNGDAPLPATAIHVIFRGDQSTTTAAFQQYLDDASGNQWGGNVGEVFSGSAGEGAVGNVATAAALRATDGSITYHEWPFAMGNRLPMARLISPVSTDPVAITVDSVGKTIAGAKFRGQGNNLVLDAPSLHNPGVVGGYPIIAVTYEIVCSSYPDAATGAAVKAFMQAAIGQGQDGLEQYGFVPLPESFTSKLSTALNAIS